MGSRYRIKNNSKNDIYKTHTIFNKYNKKSNNYTEDNLKINSDMRIFSKLDESQKKFYIKNNIYMKNTSFVYTFLKYYKNEFRPEVFINLLKEKDKEQFPSFIMAYKYFFNSKELWYDGIIEDMLLLLGLNEKKDFYNHLNNALNTIKICIEDLIDLYTLDGDFYDVKFMTFINLLPHNYNDYKITKEYKDNGIVGFYIKNKMPLLQMQKTRLNHYILRILRKMEINETTERQLIELLTFDDNIEHKSLSKAIKFNKMHFDSLLFINKLIGE